MIYIRVSTTEQVGGYSLEAQMDELKAWCLQHDYKILAVYEEPGRSAKSDERPIFQKLIRDIEKRIVCAEAVIVHRLDRFARNLTDLLNYKARLAKLKVDVISASEPLFNGQSAEDEFLLHIFGALAQYDNRKRASESKKGIDAMLRLGIYPGSSLPLGYRRVGEKRAAIIQIDPDTGPMVLTAFSEYSKGLYTLESWANEARSRGWPAQPTRWGRTFRNIFYIGQFVWGGEVYPGTHPALVSNELFSSVSSILTAQNSGGKEETHDWLLKGLLWSMPLTKAMSGTLTRGKYPYYRARRSGHPDHSIRAEELERSVIELLNKIRATGEPLPISAEWEWGIRAVPNLGYMWGVLPNLKTQKQLLNLVFFHRGILVQPSGRVEVERLKAGFERIEHE